MRVDRLDDDLDDDAADTADIEAAPDMTARPDTPAEDRLPDTGPPDRDDPRDRTDEWAAYRDKVDDIYRAYAIDQGCDRVREIEEKVVTPAMQRIEAEDPSRRLVGLDHCLKGKDRLTEKVDSYFLANPDLSCDDAFAKVKDAVRYTFQYSESEYTAGVVADVGRLQDEGFELVDSRNSWSGEQYKGLNSWWRVPESRQLFEVQFHTEASFEAKQETHAVYERLRSPKTPEDELDGLEEYQREVTARVPVPPGALDIASNLGA